MDMDLQQVSNVLAQPCCHKQCSAKFSAIDAVHLRPGVAGPCEYPNPAFRLIVGDHAVCHSFWAR
jgi:hypothetical protein